MVDRNALRENRELRTERLVLRQLGPSDVAGVWAGLSDREAMRSTGTHATFSEHAVRAFLARLPGDDERCDWAITLAADGSFVGEIALNDLREQDETMNVRIALATAEVRGQGYGSEAMRAVVDFALDDVGLHRLELSVFDFNGPARRVYEKVGFVVEGVLRDALLWDGVRHDAVLMSILATDPRPTRRF